MAQVYLLRQKPSRKLNMALLTRAKVLLHFTSTAKHFTKEDTRHKQRAASTNLPTDTWAASRAAWPAGRGRGFCPFTPLS